MTRHSKNRTASAHFSYQERQDIKGSGTQRARVGSEAFRPFHFCSLCLNPATDPRIDTKGHLFCHECIISNLIKQKQELKRQQALVDKMRVEEAAEREIALEKARERVLEDFERAQQGGGPKGKLSARLPLAGQPPAAVAGTKRKFEIETEDVAKMVKEAEAAALRQIEEEHKANRASKLASNYWLASNTPEAAPTRLEDVKLQTLCHTSQPHPLTLKMLTEVRFDRDPVAKGDVGIACWACRRTLTGNSKTHVLRPCGHALCGECASLGKESKTCPKCDAPVDAKHGFIELAREGTGFAAAGGAEAKRFDLAFQA